jgi:hypothetical protein
MDNSNPTARDRVVLLAGEQIGHEYMIAIWALIQMIVSVRSRDLRVDTSLFDELPLVPEHDATCDIQ